uniref:G-protein coupled receptors family 1 profile domain-containing protein n=1 Tax=Romanomermis culicivorax TaxID=13658 RepID=A0A915J845_ROMCU
MGTFPQIFLCGGVLGDIGTMVLGFFNICTFVPLATNIFLISLNRYCAICWPNINKTVFQDQYIIYYCFIGWLTGPLFVLFNYLTGCYMKFNESNPSFGLKCNSPNVITALSPHSIYLYICAYGTFIFYAMCIKKLRNQAVAAVTQNVAASISRKQMHVFWQALFIWMSFVATISCDSWKCYNIQATLFALICDKFRQKIVEISLEKTIKL